MNITYPSKKISNDTIEVQVRGKKYRFTDTTYKRRRNAKILQTIGTALIIVGMIFLFGLVGKSDMLDEMHVTNNINFAEFIIPALMMLVGAFIQIYKN